MPVHRIVSATGAASLEGRSFLPTPTPASASDALEFLPTVSFDDFANSLSYEHTLRDFPAPGTFKSSVPAAASTTSTASTSTTMSTSMSMSTSTPNMASLDAHAPRTSAFARRLSHSNRHSHGHGQSNSRLPSGASTVSGHTSTSEAAALPPSVTTTAPRTRRQSHFTAQPPPHAAARAPRKSVGPGTLPTNSFDARHEAARLESDSAPSQAGGSPSLGKGSRRDTLSAHPPPATGLPKLPSATRTAKAKSFQPPSRLQPGHLAVASMTPDPASMPLNSRSPGKSPVPRTHTPSSTSSRRQSTVHHISGLGARTISPTDARRLRRLSTNPNASSGPAGPPTPQGDQSFEDQIFSQSPAPAYVKSMTPSSARATPELNRKSYTSGVSLSSNSSLNSLKVNNASMSLRPNLALSSSRLPTPKQRSVHSAAGGEDGEDVPPVPAIPKAYESPKDLERSSFAFGAQHAQPSMPSPPSQDTPTATNMPISGLRRDDAQGGSPGLKNTTGSIRHRRGLTVGAGSEPDRTTAVQQSTKKNLQPLRLPPLNLLPLGTPTNNRISTFPVPSTDDNDREVTPPPKRATNKTPSTPMTASKATFFSHRSQHDETKHNKHLRSSSSAVNLRAPEANHEPVPKIGSMPIPNLNPTRQATTPFSSNSLPKGSGEYSRLQGRPSGEYRPSRDFELQSMVAGPRPLQKKDTSDSTHTSTESELETPPSNSSLRRKLSLSGWRRSSSKAASHPTQPQSARKPPPRPAETSSQTQRSGDMAPPRLPASATWSGGLGTSPTTNMNTNSNINSNRARPSLDFGRRKASTATIASDTELEKPTARKPASNAATRTLSGLIDPPAPKAVSSLSNSMHRMLGSKSSTNVLKARNLDTNLDRDDLAADDEMRRLAAKRKDFEHAARDVDELRKRAKPQERVSASQALQMVNLNIFERGEIIDYKDIYFCGTKNAKKHVGDLGASTANFGYDDDRGDYNIVFGDHLAYRYEVVDLLGKGSFGQVVRCIDHKTGGLEAIKIIRNKKRFHQQALVEVNILQKLREWVGSFFG